jgi:hypothetical protein
MRPIVLCAGIAVEDFIFKVDRFPAPGAKIQADALLAIPGGCAANAALAVARLGGVARFAGPVGTDDASRRIIAGLEQAGIESAAWRTSMAVLSPSPASSSTAPARRWWRPGAAKSSSTRGRPIPQHWSPTSAR